MASKLRLSSVLGPGRTGRGEYCRERRKDHGDGAQRRAREGLPALWQVLAPRPQPLCENGLLSDREIATVAAWLSDHAGIEVVSRDRGGGYGEAAAKALPHATQVADRWHLMENASAAFLDAVRKSMRTVRTTIGATVINPDLLTAAEKQSSTKPPVEISGGAWPRCERRFCVC